MSTLAAAHTAADHVVRALGDAGVSADANLTLTAEMITVTPQLDASADSGWSIQAAVAEAMTYGAMFFDGGRIAFGQIDGIPVLVCSEYHVVNTAGPATVDAEVIVLRVPGARRPVVVDATGGDQ